MKTEADWPDWIALIARLIPHGSCPKVSFRGRDYLFVADYGGESGALATVEAFHAGACSYAHLFADGFVRRFGTVIGRREDIIRESLPPVSTAEKH